MTARIPPTLARFLTAAVWRSPVATATDHSSQASLMLGPSTIGVDRRGTVAVARPSGRRKPVQPTKGLHRRRPFVVWSLPGPAVEAEHGPELLGGVDVGKRLTGDVDAERAADRLPSVARVPLEEAVGRRRRPHVGVVALVGGDRARFVEGVAGEPP